MKIGQLEELKLQERWHKSGVYSWNAAEPRSHTFSIDTPPPTVSGLLHMGHVFCYVQTDFIARYQRMSGKNVFYPIGFDDNGLPTERFVEKIKGIRGVDIPRDEFIKVCQDVVQNAEEDFRRLFKSLALSVDWKFEYQTISARSRKLSQMSFIDLYRKGYIHRRLGPVFWDTVDRTALAQTEIEDKGRAGLMSEVRFEKEFGGALFIATTRPELIPACVALFYHPDDLRYAALEEEYAITPIFGKKVRIIADPDVDPEKGTGLVMCCTFGDIQDIFWWRKYKLDILDCITLDGKMKNADFLDGMRVEEAREQMLKALGGMQLLGRQEEVKQYVKCGERSGAPLEIVSTEQWYIDILDHKKKILDMASRCCWHPEHMKVRLDNWINGLNQEWCISRQRFSGVQFPVWYSRRKGEEGKIIMAEVDQLPVDPLVDLPKGYTKYEVEGDRDIIDTWATSAISPQLSSLGISADLAIDGDLHKKLFPFDLRPQGHDIIRTWAFATIVKALYHENTIPWKHLMINGWCLAADKTKMSKSKGNTVTPEVLIKEKGADVVRYWSSSFRPGADVVYSEEVFKTGNKFITKLLNAAKFCFIHVKKIKAEVDSAKEASSLKTVLECYNSGHLTEYVDLWLLSRLYETTRDVTMAFERFEYCEARVVAEDFFWNDLCDNYLEIVKIRLYECVSDSKGQSAALTLYWCLDTLLRLFAPFIPHTTEALFTALGEIKSQLMGETWGFRSIHSRYMWPKLENLVYVERAKAEGVVLVKLLGLIRKAKSAKNLSLNAELDFVEICITNKQAVYLSNSALTDLKNAVNCEAIVQSDSSLIKEDTLANEDSVQVLIPESGGYKIKVVFKS